MRRPKGPARRSTRPLGINLGGRRWVWWTRRWGGVTLPFLVPQCWFCGCPECQASDEEFQSMKRPSRPESEQSGKSGPVPPPKSLSKFPHLTDLLAQPVWEGDDSKGESALFLFRASGGWRAILKVESPPLSVTVPGRDLDELLASLEAVLRQDDVPWVQDPNPLGKRDVKRKRGS